MADRGKCEDVDIRIQKTVVRRGSHEVTLNEKLSFRVKGIAGRQPRQKVMQATNTSSIVHTREVLYINLLHDFH